MTPFENFLKQHDEEAWAGTLTTLLRSIHEVDRNATQIWFSFYPLALFEALQRAADPEKLAQQLLMQGNYRLRDQIDSSHTFLYGHRYWPEVKRQTVAHAHAFSGQSSLSDQILAVAEKTASQAKVDQSLDSRRLNKRRARCRSIAGTRTSRRTRCCGIARRTTVRVCLGF
jgi:hypothetical protein